MRHALRRARAHVPCARARLAPHGYPMRLQEAPATTRRARCMNRVAVKYHRRSDLSAPVTSGSAIRWVSRGLASSIYDTSRWPGALERHLQIAAAR